MLLFVPWGRCFYHLSCSSANDQNHNRWRWSVNVFYTNSSLNMSSRFTTKSWRHVSGRQTCVIFPNVTVNHMLHGYDSRIVMLAGWYMDAAGLQLRSVNLTTKWWWRKTLISSESDVFSIIFDMLDSESSRNSHVGDFFYY